MLEVLAGPNPEVPFGREGQDYVLAPERGCEGYDALIRDLVAHGHSPTRIAHFWGVTLGESFRPGSSFLHRNLEQGFYSLLFLAQAMAEENLPRPIHLTVVTTGAAQVRVRRPLRVALLVTGDEIRQAGADRSAAQIWDVNTPMLTAANTRDRLADSRNTGQFPRR